MSKIDRVKVCLESEVKVLTTLFAKKTIQIVSGSAGVRAIQKYGCRKRQIEKQLKYFKHSNSTFLETNHQILHLHVTKPCNFKLNFIQRHLFWKGNLSNV